MKKFSISLLLIVTSTVLGDEPSAAQQMYAGALREAVSSTFTEMLIAQQIFGEPGDLTFDARLSQVVDVAEKCHMASMEIFSEEIRQQTYQVVLDGGSYADARMRMDTLLAVKAAAGDEEAEQVGEMVTQSVGSAQVCLSELESLPASP